MNVPSLIAAALRASSRTKLDLLASEGPYIAVAAQLMIDCIDRGNKVLLCGNGGSAADAQHISAELVGRYVMERRPLPAIALNTDTSALTAIGNDYGYEQVFARQVLALGQPGDLLIAITTSGKSPNILAAIAAAREKGMKVCGLTGGRGQSMRDICDVAICVPAQVTARIQECHIAIGHVLCEALDHHLAPKLAAIVIDDESTKATLEPKELGLTELLALRTHCTQAKKTLVWTNGVFDVLHAGHLASLRAARAFGDVLVVGVNADATVTAAKGSGRPIFPVTDRVALLSALEVVDYVHVFHETTPERVLGALKPDVHCKGSDYAPPHGKPIPEAALIERNGGRIAFLPMLAERSSSETVAKILQL